MTGIAGWLPVPTASPAALLAGYLAIGALLGLAAGQAALHVHSRIRGWLPQDHPAPGRKRHAAPTPMLGVVPALASALLGGLAGLPWGWTTAVLIAAAVGWWDDRAKDQHRDLRAAPKALLLLLAAACAAWGAGPDADLFTLAIATLLLFVAINAVNFLDNTDGVALQLGVVGFGILLTTARGASQADAAALLCGLWFGVLPFNWPRPRAFLGDCGALALGAALAGLAAWQVGLGPTADAPTWLPAPGFAALAIPFLDFTQVVTARLYLGYAPWIGDRRHLPHLLLLLGMKTPWVAPTLAAGALAIAATVAAL